MTTIIINNPVTNKTIKIIKNGKSLNKSILPNKSAKVYPKIVYNPDDYDFANKREKYLIEKRIRQQYS